MGYMAKLSMLKNEVDAGTKNITCMSITPFEDKRVRSKITLFFASKQNKNSKKIKVLLGLGRDIVVLAV